MLNNFKFILGMRKEFHSYLLNKVTRIEASKLKNNYLFDIYIENSSDHIIKRKIVNGKLISNLWLRSLRTGNNPSREYLDKAKKSLIFAKLSEIIHLATSEHPIRWSSAGGIVILVDDKNEKYIPLTIRPNDVFYGNRLDAQGGLSNRKLDWLFPKILGLREIIEELILIEGDKLLVPVDLPIGNDKKNESIEKYFDFKNIIQHQLTVIKSVFKKKNILGRKNIKIEDITPDKAVDLVKIHFNGKVYSNSGLVIIDPQTGSLDLRHIYQIKIGSLDNLKIIDGEVERDGSTPRNRKIILINKNDLDNINKNKNKLIHPVLTFQSGNVIKSETLNINVENNIQNDFTYLTPVLQRMLELISL